MKKYLIIAYGKNADDSKRLRVVYSDALDRARYYAEEILKDEAELTDASIFKHIDTAKRVEVQWTGRLPSNGTKKKRMGGHKDRYSKSEIELLRKLSTYNSGSSHQEVARIALKTHADKLKPGRAEKGLALIIGKIRRGLV